MIFVEFVSLPRTGERRLSCWHLLRLRGTWGAGPSFHAEELYSHANDTGADHDAFENENVAASAQRRLADGTALLANKP